MQVDIDFESEPIGMGKDGKKVFFRDIWPTSEEVAEVSCFTLKCFLEVLSFLDTCILNLFIAPSGCTIKCASRHVSGNVPSDHGRKCNLESAIRSRRNPLLLGPNINLHSRASLFQRYEHVSSRASRSQKRVLLAQFWR